MSRPAAALVVIAALLIVIPAVLFAGSREPASSAAALVSTLPAVTDSLYDGEPEAGTMIAHPADGSVMVWVPSGTFTMGINADRATKLAADMGYKDYHQIAAEEWFPERTEYVTGFFIDKYEVNVERWRKYEADSHYVAPAEWNRARWPKEATVGDYDMLPVTRIYWREAQQYCNYYNKALPTEKQWEKAARGTDARLYPWGNEQPTKTRGAFTPDIMGTKQTQTYPVGSFPEGASPYGCMDMSGNVYEWTSEWHEPYQNNPEWKRMISYMGHRNGCLRGGSFYHANYALPAMKRFGFTPEETYFHVGFRTVWQPPRDFFKSKAFKAARHAATEREKLLSAKRDATPQAPRFF